MSVRFVSPMAYAPDASHESPGSAAARTSSRRRPLYVLMAAVGLLALGAAIRLLPVGDEPRPARVEPLIPTSSAATGDRMAPLPKSRPTLVQPVAGRGTDAPATAIGTGASDDVKDTKVSGPASALDRGDVAVDGGVSGLEASTATALPNGIALPPLEAPQPVLAVIQAGNIIARSPYKWGGGHGRFQDTGYDCSGSVTYALYYAGLISRSASSGELMSYGKPGPGKWISICANPGHVYMVVAGVRFDTVARKLTGSRWQNSKVSAAGRYEVRHPPGL